MEGASALLARLGLVYRAGLVLVVAAVLSGCALAPLMVTPRPPAIFDLTAPADVAVPAGTHAQILIPEPSAFEALNTERIAARPTVLQYAYLPGAVWSDRLPSLVQARLMEAFQNSGRVRAVGLPGQGLLIHYQVILDIRSFEVFDDYALVAFAVKLLDDETGEVMGTRIMRAKAPVPGPDTAAAVVGLNAAMDAAFIETIRWVLSRV